MSKKILIVDDDPGIVDVIKTILREDGYEADTISDTNVIKKVLADPPDVLLMDVWMPGIDGRQICRKLKKNSRTKSIPIIMISASSDIRAWFEDSGAQDYIEKPFDMNSLLGKIKKYA